MGLGEAVVLSLVRELEGRKHDIYMDNFYSSPSLFTQLARRGFGACGTVNVKRRGMPTEMQREIAKGEVIAIDLHQGMMALKWKDKRPVTMLTTIHDDRMISKRRRTRRAEGGQEYIEKPRVVEEYNRHMGGVDKSDQYLVYYSFGHRTLKWWKRIFFHLLDVAIVNAYILYRQTPTEDGKHLTHEHFRIELAKGLLQSSACDAPRLAGPTRQTHPPLTRLTERHFPGRLGYKSDGHPVQLDCFVCSRRSEGKRKVVTTKCKQCDLPMCIFECFELYHTKVDYHKYL